MRKDPLNFFLDEKVAADSAPSTSLEVEPQRAFSKDPDPDSIDPGERAMAGMIAGGGTALGGLGGWLANNALSNKMFQESVGVSKHVGYQPASRMRDLQQGQPRAKVLGLFDVQARQPKPIDPAAFAKDMARLDAGQSAKHPVTKSVMSQSVAQGKISKTVDSFIDKHNLAKKGVTLNIKAGPLNWIGGPRYEIPTKRVFLPSISKELALHELGHAADYTKGRIGKIRGISDPLLRRGATIALPIALIAGDRIKEILPGSIDDRAIEYMQNHAPEIMAATLAATSLYPEAKASVLALQHIAKTEGRAAAMKALPKLGAGWGTYVLGAIPAIVGLSLARKYMREARGDKSKTDEFATEKLRELEKKSGILNPIETIRGLGKAVPEAGRWVRSSARDISHVGIQIGKQSQRLISEPGTMRRIGEAAKEIGTSPTFVHGAMVSALPAAMSSLYLYGSESGKEIRKRLTPDSITKVQTGSDTKRKLLVDHTTDEWRERNPLLFTGLVAAGAAMSGGIITKLFSDLARVL